MLIFYFVSSELILKLLTDRDDHDSLTDRGQQEK